MQIFLQSKKKAVMVIGSITLTQLILDPLHPAWLIISATLLSPCSLFYQNFFSCVLNEVVHFVQINPNKATPL